MSLLPMPTRGIYAITPSDLRSESVLLAQVDAVLSAGVAVLQYRDKQADTDRRQRLAAELRTLCSKANVPLIVNDDIALAQQVGADGVHLGRDDSAIQSACQQLPDAIVGASCYASPERAIAAAAAGARYVAFGRFFPSATKPEASPADLSVLKQWRSAAELGLSEKAGNLALPCVAIGGIDASNGATLCSAGADLLAVCGGIFDTEDPVKATQQLASLYL